MAYEEHLSKLHESVERWNQWGRINPLLAKAVASLFWAGLSLLRTRVAAPAVGIRCLHGRF